jgi:YD repeat-containing protein
VTYYDAAGRVQGTVRRQGETTYFYDASGRSMGSARGEVPSGVWPIPVEKAEP